MKKSRLNLFKSTSMMISILGVLMIISTIIIAAYIGFSIISSEITSGVSSGSQYDELASLKSNYTELESKFNSTKEVIFAGSDKTKEQQYISAELELLRANSAISDVESALKSGKSASDVDDRIKIAKEKMTIATQAYNNL
ncbi:MAG: hypothetical protein VB038_09440 [Methanobrevibacter sp.]|nr:hypothetical protein [Methanobrevibacter sp.]MEA4957940.1 hypothetical protein [Methanobrevibacter sp.]